MSRAALLTVALPGAMLAACSGGSTAARTSSFAGRWILESVNGAALPFTASQSATTKTEIVSDVIVASPSGSFTDSMTVRTTDSGQVTTAVVPNSGIWALDGSTVTFTFFVDGHATSASFDGTALTVSASSRSYVYRR